MGSHLHFKERQPGMVTWTWLYKPEHGRQGCEKRSGETGADVAGGGGGGLSLGPCAGASGAQGKGREGALRSARRSSWGLSAFCGSLVSRTQRAAQDFGSQHLSDW